MRRFLIYFPVGFITFALGVGGVLLTVDYNHQTARSDPSTAVFDESLMKNVVGFDPFEEHFRNGDYNHLIHGNGSPLTFICNDPQIKPSWKLILKDKAARQYLDYRNQSGRKIDCSDEFRKPTYLNVDINGSGLPKLVVKGKWGRDYCGMYSGCWFGIFEIRGNRYKPIIINGNVTRFSIEHGSADGYRDLILYSSGGGNGEYSDHYRFDGHRYNLKKCYLTTFDYYDSENRIRHSNKPMTVENGCPEQ